MASLLYIWLKREEREVFYSDEELEKYFKKHGRDGAVIQRYKGLGEMDADRTERHHNGPGTKDVTTGNNQRCHARRRDLYRVDG